MTATIISSEWNECSDRADAVNHARTTGQAVWLYRDSVIQYARLARPGEALEAVAAEVNANYESEQPADTLELLAR